MEGLNGEIDLETVKTLKSSYLFPATPFNKSLYEEVLSTLLLSGPVYSMAAALTTLHSIWDVTYDVESALLKADLKLVKDRGPACGFESKTELLFLLNAADKPLLRNDGKSVVHVNDIMGKKYVMACILSVPDSCISFAWDVAKKSAELYAQRKDDFECIIFLRKRLYGWEEFANFADFHALFDRSCIITHLNHDYSAAYSHNELLVFEPNSKLVLHSYLSRISEVGSAAFPFDEAYLSSLSEERLQLNHSSLETLLGVQPSHKFFRKIPGTDPLQEEWRCISEFRSKIVFLYIYSHGDHLNNLYNTLKGLREKGMEFEIITAYVPHCQDRFPTEFLEVFSSLVAKLGLSWWVVPYDSSTYPRLRPLYADFALSDRMIVFDPKLDGGDPHGLEVLTFIDQSMFPFTKMSAVEHVEEELKQITLKSLFEHVTHLCREDDPRYVRDTNSVLEGKDVLVYFDTAVAPSTALDDIDSWYFSLGEKEKRRNNFEVVCVYLENVPERDNNSYKYKYKSRCKFPKWLISSDDQKKTCAKYVADNFFLKLFKHKLSTVVAFGKDGKIGSLCAQSLLSSSSSSSSSSSGAVPFPLEGDLRREIFNIFDEYCTRLCSN